MYFKKIKELLESDYNLTLKLSEQFASNKKELVGWSNGIIYVPSFFRVPEGNEYMTCHIFGHLVQYSCGKGFYEVPDRNLTDQEYFEYEKEAFAYGKSILEQVAPYDTAYLLNYVTFWLADYQYFSSYMKTGVENLDIFFDKYLEGNIHNIELVSKSLEDFDLDKAQKSLEELIVV